MQTFFVRNDTHDVFKDARAEPAALPNLTLLDGSPIRKAVEDAPSNQEEPWIGLMQRPFDYGTAMAFRDQNGYHSTCIQTKVAATTGLGFVKDQPAEPVASAPVASGATSPALPPAAPERTPERDRLRKTETEKALDLLTETSMKEVLDTMTFDLYELGIGFLEIVRGPDGDSISGVYPLFARDVWVHQDSLLTRDYHYVIQGCGGLSGNLIGRRFARFGDKENFLRRYPGLDPAKVSEVLVFKHPNNRSRHYGVPDWLSATSKLALSSEITRFQYSFFKNRGVPELALFFKGAKLGDEEWKAIKELLRKLSGAGNSHKSLALEIPPGTDVQVERLAMDQTADPIQFSKTEETNALSIVSAHRVPPALAGILIPGKMGAANEILNNMIAFHALVVSQTQVLIAETLKKAFRDQPGIDEDEIEFRTIIDELKTVKQAEGVQETDTALRMRDEIGAANLEGRNMQDGLED